MTSRRSFIKTLPLAGSFVLLAQSVRGADMPMVDPKDPQAVALGYVNEAGNADKAKFPKFAPGQACSGCQLYQGQPGAASGGCTLFAGKQVAAKGWCSAYAKKA